MTVATPVQPDRTTQNGTQYTSNIDAATKVALQHTGQFAPHERTTTPDMTVTVDAGFIQLGQTVVQQGANISGPLTAPTTNPRIDRVVMTTTGTLQIAVGVESATPVPPPIFPNQFLICQVYLTPGMTQIFNSAITDERPMFFSAGVGGVKNSFVMTFAPATNQGITPGSLPHNVIWDAVVTDPHSQAPGASVTEIPIPAAATYFEARCVLYTGSTSEVGIYRELQIDGRISGPFSGQGIDVRTPPGLGTNNRTSLVAHVPLTQVAGHTTLRAVFNSDNTNNTNIIDTWSTFQLDWWE